MPYAFYSSNEYRKKQALTTKSAWKRGVYKNKVRPLVLKICKNKQCSRIFYTKPSEPKIFCSRSCSASFNNLGRIHSEFSKMKISEKISKLPHRKFPDRIKRVRLVCRACGRAFEVQPYLSKIQKYCSVKCSISTTGKMTTSPKASKGKFGIREDVSPSIIFYSTWEANVARVFNLVNINWRYAPKIFDLGEHTYRPDFYLSDFDIFIEVKNFMGNYSLQRDSLFRKKYPNVKLELIMKKDYLSIRDNYKELISNWED